MRGFLFISFAFGSPVSRNKWGVRLLAFAVKKISNLAGERLQGERLLQECRARLEHAFMDDGIFCVTGEKQNLDRLPYRRDALCQFTSAHSWHHDICDQNVDFSLV